MAKWSRLTPGVHADPAPALQDLPQTGRITSVSASGAFIVLDNMQGLKLGPAPWGLGSHATFDAAIAAGWTPLVNDRALVVFAGVGVGAPVITAWWR